MGNPQPLRSQCWSAGPESLRNRGRATVVFILMQRAVVLLVAVGLLIAGAFSWLARARPEPLPADAARLGKATFAGGCYWCMEPTFDHVPGVVHVQAGYAGDGGERREAVEVLFDPKQI